MEVRRDGRTVELPGGKPRAVLAFLLLHANEPLSAERLARALWGENARAGAARTVQVYVSRLRRALGDHELLATSRAGYRLLVRPGEFNLERFERLVEEGRGEVAQGRATQAGGLLREALGLWRGPPGRRARRRTRARCGRLCDQGAPCWRAGRRGRGRRATRVPLAA